MADGHAKAINMGLLSSISGYCRYLAGPSMFDSGNSGWYPWSDGNFNPKTEFGPAYCNQYK
jgi:hypothetical protein